MKAAEPDAQDGAGSRRVADALFLYGNVCVVSVYYGVLRGWQEHAFSAQPSSFPRLCGRNVLLFAGLYGPLFVAADQLLQLFRDRRGA